jgi:prepilin signal peptidase PulO-like enzyme (type II secretory pathway)
MNSFMIRPITEGFIAGVTVATLYLTSHCWLAIPENRSTSRKWISLTVILLFTIGYPIAALHTQGDRFVITCLVFSIFVLLSAIDASYHLLPDALTLPGIIVAVTASALNLTSVDTLDSILGTLIGYFTFYSVNTIYVWWRHTDGVGQGDWKMAAMMGAWFGASHLFLAIVIASIAGLIVSIALLASRRISRATPVPFGSFLGISSLVFSLFRADVWALYSRLF